VDEEPCGMLALGDSKIHIRSEGSYRITFFSPGGQRLCSMRGIRNATFDLPRFAGMSIVRMETGDGSVFTKTVVSVADW
jgi:hypothetical protein